MVFDTYVHNSNEASFIRITRGIFSLVMIASIVMFTGEVFLTAFHEQANMPSTVYTSDRRLATALNGFQGNVSWNVFAVSVQKQSTPLIVNLLHSVH